MRSPESMGGRSRNPEILEGAELGSGSLFARDAADDIIDCAVADRTGDTALFVHVMMLQAEGYVDVVSERELARLGTDRLASIAEKLLELDAIETTSSGWWTPTRAGIEAAWRLLP